MKVFKFGGASVKDTKAVQNVAFLLKNYTPNQVVVVLSAMGKTTNALEQILHSWYAQDGKGVELIESCKSFHVKIMDELFPEKEHFVFQQIESYFNILKTYISQKPLGNWDFDYAQIVSYGELISTCILHEYLVSQSFDCQLIDSRKTILTDATWREGKVNWDKTEKAILQTIQPILAQAKGKKIILTQGFLGGTSKGSVTTLGREGSDYTAAILSYVLNAEEMVLWKDVAGVLNADPKVFENTVLLPKISYHEALELTYYGASIIHPKTIKPLENKKIPLHVRSFLDPESAGTIITDTSGIETVTPSFIVKSNQLLVSISPKDFSFIAEQNLSEIFSAFAKSGIQINMMQNSAISFTACISQDDRKFERLLKLLHKNFKVKYNGNLQLVTIRHWTAQTVEAIVSGKIVLSEQRNRATVQVVLK